MATSKPDDKKEPARLPRSGHGAASLIPHLPSNNALEQPQAADTAPVEETDKPQAQGDAAGPAPQGG